MQMFYEIKQSFKREWNTFARERKEFVSKHKSIGIQFLLPYIYSIYNHHVPLRQRWVTLALEIHFPAEFSPNLIKHSQANQGLQNY